MEQTHQRLLSDQRVGGLAALYLAIAYLAAMPYFLVVLNDQGVVDPVARLALLVNHRVTCTSSTSSRMWCLASCSPSWHGRGSVVALRAPINVFRIDSPRAVQRDGAAPPAGWSPTLTNVNVP
ncbi:MAG: hypothetical protein HC834_05410 [Rhodospirillales bacterium]|nr:hypothetical protein [Rhodospirillales bacterium]